MKSILRGACLLLALVALGCNNNDKNDGGTPDAGHPDSGQPDSGQPDAGANGIMVGTVFAPYDTWTYIPVDGTKCADGSSTGFGINPHKGSARLNVSFEGGGACWSTATCTTGNPTGAPLAANLNGVANADIANAANYDLFKRTGFNNPFANDNFIFIPYCTGDVHTGNNVATYDSFYSDGGSASLNHVGFVNTTLDMATVMEAFPTTSVDSIIVTGVSAGGYGALFNYDRIKAMYPDATPYLVDDSGPVLQPDVGSIAVYSEWNAQWGTQANIPSGCTDCILTGGNSKGWWKIFPYLAEQSNFRGSLLSSTQDATISGFYYFASGNAADACSPLVPGHQCLFEQSLLDLHTNVLAPAAPGKMHVFFVDSLVHTYLDGDLHGDTALQNFLSEQLDGGNFADVVPAP